MEPLIGTNSTYGQLPADSGVTFNDPETGNEVNMKIKLYGYGSSSMSLIQDKIYLLSGRILAPNVKSAPVLYYEQELVFPIGDAEGYPVSLSNKTTVWGFGIVVTKKEVEDSAPGQAKFKSLYVVLKHTDYDNQSRGQVAFNVSYKIPGNRNLSKTFGLFQLGHEMVLSGYINGYDRLNKVLQVHTLSVSLASGHDSSVGNESDDKSGSMPIGRKHFQIDFDSDEETESPFAGPSKPFGENCPVPVSGDEALPNCWPTVHYLALRKQVF
ncbi:hypothetical protein KEM48_013553 [Puccinia striiformis f. sp. tritici PST-130]|uniref:Uncharacterized protein n=1 Tax=Puccinia striiformis f. sp. tritici PST-78 TaxID=1165861 RepID=A0A0L0V0Q2_9BASI|nr:hypothetical protein Pst134EB_010493 [Puccinia striiformis f. sp. tritici]KAI9630786.1 hypothetical protein KEM48_013553 [Puccinia striiformis f. sp. tritici PST-130]KNE92862.1 hypothetical protein PSTG_13773 [Puccinia striiformis f. sp. tritici PST-78]